MRDLVDEYWKLANSEIIRFEQRATYPVPKDFTRYKKTAGETPTLDDVKQDWSKRVRVLDVPLSGSQRSEIEQKYLPAEQNGESTIILSRKDFRALVRAHGLSEFDFWSFDRERFLIIAYDKQGLYDGEVEVQTESERQALKKQIEILFAAAVPLQSFLETIS
jgi:hypothetical protein